MKTFLLILIILSISILAGYGIKRYFDFRVAQGKETSNAPIRLAIAALVIAFLAIVGFAPLVAGILIQLLNHIPGVSLKETQTGEIIAVVAFIAFCSAIVLVIYLYYRYRSGLYSKDELKSSGAVGSRGKNIVNQSNINAGGDIHIGDYKKTRGR